MWVDVENDQSHQLTLSAVFRSWLLQVVAAVSSGVVSTQWGLSGPSWHRSMHDQEGRDCDMAAEQFEVVHDIAEWSAIDSPCVASELEAA